MGEREAIERADAPVTVESLVADLRALGVRTGETLLVHSSLSALGWVCGGAEAAVAALQEAVTPDGTLVVPTHTGRLMDPAEWQHPPVPDDWVETVRASMPAYRPAVTACQTGAIPECLRLHPGAVRSRHPLVSFAAWGADADAVVADHSLANGLGESSPLAAVYERDGRVLLLGVGHEANTSMHLAEYRADVSPGTVTRVAPVLRDGERVRAEFEDIDRTDDDFERLGAAFERERGSASATAGEADALLHDQRTVVDFAVDWLAEHR